MLYTDRDSFLHRLPPGAKLLFLAVYSALVFIYDNLAVSLGSVMIVTALYLLAKLSLHKMWISLKPMLFFMLIIFAFQWWQSNLMHALVIILRLISLLWLAMLVTYTTKTSDLIAALERVLYPLKFLGINVSKISLAIALCIRFIPVIAGVTEQIKEAQKTRGLEKNWFALFVPLMIRSLKMSDDIAQAIDARSFYD